MDSFLALHLDSKLRRSPVQPLQGCQYLISCRSCNRMRPPPRSPLSFVLLSLPRTSGAPHRAPVALFGRNLWLLGPWALFGEGGNRPDGGDWQGGLLTEEAETRGVRGRRSSGFTGTRGEMVTWAQEELGVRGNGAEKKGDPGAGVHERHSPDEGSRVVPGSLHWCGPSCPKAAPLKSLPCPPRPATT